MTTITDNSIEQINAALLNLKKDIINNTLSEDKIKKIAASTKTESKTDLSSYATIKYVQDYVVEHQTDTSNIATVSYVNSMNSTVNNRIDGLVIPTIEVLFNSNSPETVGVSGGNARPIAGNTSYYRFRINYSIKSPSGICQWTNNFQSSSQIVTITNTTSRPIAVVVSNNIGGVERMIVNANRSATTSEIGSGTSASPSNTPTCVTITWSAG